jgi:hypothetical protein
MNFFDRFKQHATASKLMSTLTLLFLIISVVLTVRISQLQQDLRQRAGGPQCINDGADCNNGNGKICCSGASACRPKQQGGGSSCQAIVQAPTSTPTPYIQPTNSEGAPTTQPNNDTGAASTPTPVVCGPNGCGWSPRPEGENSTTLPPGVSVCTLTFNGPTQLLGTRLSPTSMRFNWWPTPGGADKQFLMYGLESGKPQWGMINIAGNQGQIIVDHLPSNKTIWAAVRAYRGNCYEDTTWISVGTVRRTAQANTIPQQTIIPSAPISVQPSSVSMNTVYSSPSPTPKTPQVKILGTWNTSGWIALFITLLIATMFLLRKYLFLFILKKKRKNKTSDQ